MAPLGNPNYPCIAGGEILPVASTTVPVDLGSRYDLEHDVRASAAGTNDGRITATFIAAHARQLHHVAFELYLAGDETPNDAITTLVLPLRRVDKGATAVIIGGGTALAALSTPSGAYIQMDSTLATPYVYCWFDPAQLTMGDPITDWSRIVRVGLRYLAFKDDSSTLALAVGEGLNAYQHDTGLMSGSPYKYASWLTPDYQRSATYVTRWLGETNHLPHDVTSDWRLMPFSVTDLARMAAGDETLFWSLHAVPGPDSSQTTVYVQQVEMVVEVAPERRQGVATRLVTNLATGYAYGSQPSISEWRSPLDPASAIIIDAARYVATIREALPASPSDRYRAATSGAWNFSFPEAIGPSLDLLGITQARPTQAPQLETRLATISGGVVVGVPAPFEDFNLAVVAYEEASRVADGPFWAAYTSLISGAEIRLTYLADIVQTFTADGATTYAGVKIMCRPDPLTTEGVLIMLQQPLGTPIAQVTLGAAAVRALPDAGGGWRIVAADFTAGTIPATLAAAPAYLVAHLFTAEAVWFISGADLLGATLYDHGGDHAMVATCPAAVPPAPTVTAEATAILGGAACGVSEINHLHLSWSVDADAAVYAVQRSVDLGSTWTVIAYLDSADAVAGVLDYDDLGAPWDVDVVYWLTAYRAADLLATTGAASTPIAIASGGAVLGLSSASTAMVYAPAADAGVSMEWTDLSPVDYVQLAGETGQRALRGPEDRGLSLTVAVLIAELAACTLSDPPVPEALEVAARALDPAPWDQVRVLAREARLDVRLPGGATRVMSLALSGLSARTAAGVYAAELTLTDVHAELTNPLDGT